MFLICMGIISSRTFFVSFHLVILLPLKALKRDEEYKTPFEFFESVLEFFYPYPKDILLYMHIDLRYSLIAHILYSFPPLSSQFTNWPIGLSGRFARPPFAIVASWENMLCSLELLNSSSFFTCPCIPFNVSFKYVWT